VEAKVGANVEDIKRRRVIILARRKYELIE
jgi:hypothetical protein